MKNLLLSLLFVSSLFSATPGPTYTDVNRGQNGIYQGKFNGDGSGLTNLQLRVSVRSFGAIGNGVHDDSAAFTAAYDAVKTYGGTVYVPFTTNYYRANPVLTNCSVTWQGDSASVLGPKALGQAAGFYVGSVIIPADPTIPAMTVGSDRLGEMTRDSYVKDIAFVGSVTTTNLFANTGIKIGGGAEGVVFENVPVGFFKTNYNIGGSTNNLTYAITLINSGIVMPNGNSNPSDSNSFVGLYLHAPLTTTTNLGTNFFSFTTHIKFVGASRLYGAPFGYNIVNDGVEADLDGLYSDSFSSTATNSHQLLLLKTATADFSPYPTVKHAIFDGGGIQVVVGYDNGVVGGAANSPNYYVPNSYMNGSIKYWDGNIQAVPAGLGGIGTQYYEQSRQVFQGSQYLKIPDNYGSIIGGGFPASVNHSASASGDYAINSWRNVELYTGNGGTDGTVKIVGASNPSITLVRNSGAFENMVLQMTSNSFTINPPGTSSGFVAITGKKFNVNTNGDMIVNTLVSTNDISIGLNGRITTLSTNLTFVAPQEIFMYTETGLLVAGTNTPSFYLYDRGSGSLMTMRSGATNVIWNMPSTNSQRGKLTLNGSMGFSGPMTYFTPPQMSLLDRSVLSPQEGNIIYQSDNGLGMRFYENAGWHHPLYDDPGTLGHYIRGDGTKYIDSALLAADLTGTVNDSRLSTNIANLLANNNFQGANQLTNTANNFAGNGGAITNIQATNIVGNIPSSNLGTNVALLNAPNIFTARNTNTAGLSVTGGTNIFVGATAMANSGNILGGDGSAITGLTGPQITSGLIPIARLGTGSGVANTYLDGSGAFLPFSNSLNLGFDSTLKQTASGDISYNFTIPANTLATNGDSFSFTASGQYFNSGVSPFSSILYINSSPIMTNTIPVDAGATTYRAFVLNGTITRIGSTSIDFAGVFNSLYTNVTIAARPSVTLSSSFPISLNAASTAAPNNMQFFNMKIYPVIH